MAVATPKIKLYTNHGCPWAHRAHIALSEINVPFEEEIIDLAVPRTAEYLKVNPRGLVPSLKYDGHVLTESAIVATFLADAFPAAGLAPPSTSPAGALARARIAFFVDTYFSKVQGHWVSAMHAAAEAARAAAGAAFVDAVAEQIDPLLADAAPFFGGSSKLTLAEVLTGSFLLRLYDLGKFDLFPESALTSLAEKAPNFDKWAKAVIKHPSVNNIWDAETVGIKTQQRVAKARAQG